MTNKIKIGISACLRGEKVRYDGGSFQPKLINSVLSRHLDFVSLCPEVEMGMSIPRETLRLVKTDQSLRLVAPKSGEDHTEAMNTYAAEKVELLRSLGLSGYIVKKGSPSCGLERVKNYTEKGFPSQTGMGMFTSKLREAFPNIPIEEDGRLNDIGLRAHWVERVFAYDRLKKFLSTTPSLGKLMRFHAQSKMQLMAHHPANYRLLGRKVAQCSTRNLEYFYPIYENEFMEILNVKPTVNKHTDVIYHMMGFIKNKLNRSDKKEMSALIEQFRNRVVPIIVPLTLLNHFFSKNPHPWIQTQTYLNPFPADLSLHCSIGG